MVNGVSSGAEGAEGLSRPLDVEPVTTLRPSLEEMAAMFMADEESSGSTSSEGASRVEGSRAQEVVEIEDSGEPEVVAGVGGIEEVGGPQVVAEVEGVEGVGGPPVVEEVEGLDTRAVDGVEGRVNMAAVRAMLEERGMDLERFQLADPEPGWGIRCAEGDTAAFYLHIFKAGFQLPLGAFFCSLLRAYGVSPNQIKANAWSIMVTYYMACREMEWRPSINVFRSLYALVSSSKCLFHLQSRGGGGPVYGLPSNPHMKMEQFFLVQKGREEEWGFELAWRKKSAQSNDLPDLEPWEEEQLEALQGSEMNFKEVATPASFRRWCAGEAPEDVEGREEGQPRRRRRLQRKARGGPPDGEAENLDDAEVGGGVDVAGVGSGVEEEGRAAEGIFL